MFPYPSGAGLHVGHPLGYIACDIYARYKRHQGYNVLQPMGYDSFGLPAEQYAIQTGQHPAITTRTNINRYREQLDQLGFSYDWSRQVRTSDPEYYRWTQWVFMQLFDSWYNKDSDKAEPVATLIKAFEASGNAGINAACDEDTPEFSAAGWKAMSEAEQQRILLKHRLTYLADTEVNWCPELGTVLANDEVVNGVSERGGYPVIRKKMTQWSMRITAYAQRLLDGLESIDWPQPLKDAQTNWIGRSKGASVTFRSKPVTPGGERYDLEVFTTRPDTIYGVSFMTLAPEHELVLELTTDPQRKAVEAYVEASARRSERERMADVKSISGVFTGAYAEHPLTGEDVPIWIGDYVLAGYGTGAVMAVPCGDQRDYDFAKHFDLPIPNIFEGVSIEEEAYADKAGTVIANSDFISGMGYKEASNAVIEALEAKGLGKGTINYRLRDAVFSRQRYWGEPFPVYYDADGLPRLLPEDCLPLELPEVEKYLPTETGEPPLGNATHWAWDAESLSVTANDRIDHKTVFPLELNTMPGWAGSSQYFNRYMDPDNTGALVGKEAIDYWKDVDLYIGGSEHATGHLLYSRFWQHFMYDRGWVPVKEYARKLINQGMITGHSAYISRIKPYIPQVINVAISEDTKSSRIISNENQEDLAFKKDYFVTRKIRNQLAHNSSDFSLLSIELYDEIKTIAKSLNKDPKNILLQVIPIRIDVSLVGGSDEVDLEKLRLWQPQFRDASFELEEGKMIASREVEKMSKSKYNVVNPDQICEEYGADSLRLYEMFLGPLEQSKPWNTAGLSGVHNFLKKLWKLYHQGPDREFEVLEGEASKENMKTLHKTIKKVQDDIESFSFNTTVSSLMICVNELSSQGCRERAVLEPLAILLSPYAPHIAEELWNKLGHSNSVAFASFPQFEEKHLVEQSKEYPISFNGKMRFTLELPLDLSREEIEAQVMADERTQKQLGGRTPKKVIVVPGKIVNIVG